MKLAAGDMTTITTTAELEAALAGRLAVLFLWVNWSIPANQSRANLEKGLALARGATQRLQCEPKCAGSCSWLRPVLVYDVDAPRGRDS
jgi:hypothetical protein